MTSRRCANRSSPFVASLRKRPTKHPPPPKCSPYFIYTSMYLCTYVPAQNYDHLFLMSEIVYWFLRIFHHKMCGISFFPFKTNFSILNDTYNTTIYTHTQKNTHKHASQTNRTRSEAGAPDYQRPPRVCPSPIIRSSSFAWFGWYGCGQQQLHLTYFKRVCVCVFCVRGGRRRHLVPRCLVLLRSFRPCDYVHTKWNELNKRQPSHTLKRNFWLGVPVLCTKSSDEIWGALEYWYCKLSWTIVKLIEDFMWVIQKYQIHCVCYTDHNSKN